MNAESARWQVTDAVARQAGDFPDISPVEMDLSGLSPRDRALAVAIHRTVLQRWLSCRYVLGKVVEKPFEKLEPQLAAAMLVGAAQLLFMERQAGYAVVDEAVEYAKRRMRPGAGAMVNAVLRKVVGSQWEMPGGMTDEELSVRTSHPVGLVAAWRKRFGDQRAVELLEHSNVTPPIIVHAPDAEGLEAHEREGFVVWRGDHESLRGFLGESGRRWVQDVTSAAPVMATGDLRPRVIVDYCAGMGTKTRQLADVHREARIVATDTDGKRFAELQRVFAGHQCVQVIEMGKVALLRGQVDLLLLDVPCSNTGVLARRLEARYRYRQGAVDSVVELQRRIIGAAGPLLSSEGVLIYSTCSVEPVENERQAEWAAGRLGRKVISQQGTQPGGEGRMYHDGGYWARIG